MMVAKRRRLLRERRAGAGME